MFVKLLASKQITWVLVVILLSLLLALFRVSQPLAGATDASSNVLYFVSSDYENIELGLLPSEMLSKAPQDMAIGVVNRWNDVEQALITSNVEAIIIHHSAEEMVDKEKLATWFQQGELTVMGIGIPGFKLANSFLGMPELFTTTWTRAARSNEEQLYKTNYYYYLYYFSIEGSDSDVFQIMHGEQKVNLSDIPERDVLVKNPLSIRAGAHTESLWIDSGLSQMFTILGSYVNSVGQETAPTAVSVEQVSTSTLLRPHMLFLLFLFFIFLTFITYSWCSEQGFSRGIINIFLIGGIVATLSIMFFRTVYAGVDEVVVVSSQYGVNGYLRDVPAADPDNYLAWTSRQSSSAYHILVSGRLWGPCSPDMGCPSGWTEKGTDFIERYWSSGAGNASIYKGGDGLKIAQHMSRPVPTTWYFSGYTSEHAPYTGPWNGWGCFSYGPNTNQCP